MRFSSTLLSNRPRVAARAIALAMAAAVAGAACPAQAAAASQRVPDGAPAPASVGNAVMPDVRARPSDASVAVPSATPEPASFALLGFGLAALAVAGVSARRRR